MNGKTGKGFFDHIPHPSLSDGQPVLTAGTLIPTFDSNGKLIELEINNKSGHFKPTGESLDYIETKLLEKSQNEKFIINKNPLNQTK